MPRWYRRLVSCREGLSPDKTRTSGGAFETPPLGAGYFPQSRLTPFVLSVRWETSLTAFSCALNECPLGSGALAGNPFGIDREALAADALHFSGAVGMRCYAAGQPLTVRLDGVWRDAEVDEVSTKKKLVWRPPTNPGQKATAAVARMEWDSWLGMQERGKPESLVLVQLPKRLTKPTAPGPGRP